jgi:putative hemin transport protein
METTAVNNRVVLKSKWLELKESEPGIRIRNAALKLGVTELDLLLCNSDSTTILRNDPQALLRRIESLGRVMALTRNEYCVHERKGVYLNPQLNNPMVGLFVGEDIDLRFFFSIWKYTVAVTEGFGKQTRMSIQFFSSWGEAIHKIYLTPDSDVRKYQELVNEFRANSEELIIDHASKPSKEVFTKIDEVDVDEFQKQWLEMKDPHEFFGILKKFRLSRVDALKLAPSGGYSVAIQPTSLHELLVNCSTKECPIMAFVGNAGAIQIHTGKIHSVVLMEKWLNILDPDFNLHLLQDAVAEVWIVKKPAEESFVTSIECFDKEGEMIVQFFGKRKPGIPELESWRDLVKEIQSKYSLS